MKKRPFHILSIDFDYFQKTTEELLATCYPDGHDLSTDISKLIWMGYYGDPKTANKMKQIRCDNQKVNQVIRTLLKQPDIQDIPIIAVNSHKYIVTFIEDICLTAPYEPLHVTNLDIHHDAFHSDKSLNCGNWVIYLFTHYTKFQYTWVQNPISDELYPIKNAYVKAHTKITKDLTSALNQHFDAIFLCRSDIWLPPHLDTDFAELLSAFRKVNKQLYTTSDISVPRDMTHLIENYKNIIVDNA